MLRIMWGIMKRFIRRTSISCGSSVEGDDRKINQSIQGTIDYFTKEEDDAFVEQIQAALKAACISFYLNSVQYEGQDEGGAGYIHYEWVWEVA